MVIPRLFHHSYFFLYLKIDIKRTWMILIFLYHILKTNIKASILN